MADPSTILKNAANAADARVAMMYPLVRVRSPARPALCGGPVTSEIGSLATRVRVRSDTLVQHCLCCVSHWPHAAISLAAGAHGCLKRCREQ